MTRRRHLVACCVAVLALAGCAGPDDPPAPGPTPIGDVTSYVALGDSYVSGPEIDGSVPEAGFCLRSTRNYPALLAADLDVDDAVDVSCAGATTAGILAPSTVSQLPVPAQLDAVTADTELVTIGIGGNDDGLTTSLFVSCLITVSRSAEACDRVVPSTSPPMYPTILANLASTLDAVAATAPRARIVLVGYLTIVGGTGDCDPLALDAAGAERAAAVMDALENTQQEAARTSGVEFVSLREMSAEHDVCADDPWVNGLTGTPGDGAFLHPKEAGMEAVADRLAGYLRAD
ncbi:MAG: SGNH/GDSL hydrolase family protein [Aeromicrobium sp.]